MVWCLVGLDLYAVLEVVLYISTDDAVSTPAIGFSNRVLAFLADVNASIDIDTYILPYEENADLDDTVPLKPADEKKRGPECKM